MTQRVARVSHALVGGIRASLIASQRLTLGEPRGDSILTASAPDGGRIELRRDGTITYQDTDAVRALVVQALKGNLATSPHRYLLGIDEAGIGREANQAYVAAVLISADVRADLIAAGVRDSKSISETTELERLGDIIRTNSPFHKVVPLSAPPEGGSFATQAALATAEIIKDVFERGLNKDGIHIRVDQTDKETLATALGAYWPEVQDIITISKYAEENTEVAAASVLATLSARESGRPAQVRKDEDLKFDPFAIAPAQAADEDQVVALLHRLELSYPEIAKWIEGASGKPGVWSKIANDAYSCSVARLGSEVAGFCISQPKGDRNAKISTFYVKPNYQKQHVGARLLQREILRLAQQSCRRVIVTFGHEEFSPMQPFLTRYGFTVDGISPQRYRDNSYEVIMGKRFDYRTIQPSGFAEFVEHSMFKMTGYETHRLDEHTFLATPKQALFAIHQLPAERQYLVRTTIAPNPENEIATARQMAKDRGAKPILASHYGLLADQPVSKDVLVFDAYDIEIAFLPLHLERPEDQDVIIPIEPVWAQKLIAGQAQATFGTKALNIRTDHVYYRGDSGGRELRRGGRVFFYVSGQKNMHIIAHARLRKISRGSPAKLHAQHGGQGAWTRSEIEAHTGGEDAMAYLFEWTQRMRTKIPLDRVKEIIPRYQPITAFPITHSEGDQLIAQGGQL